ncbi:MAG: bifunctional ADP-dependent NAD(P)H-hydrate dehydratase/NAD(P)H-hydrate epimerase [Chloroflexi bacterium OHK40]
MRLVTAAQMRALEQAAVAAGATWEGLMEQAGWGVAQEALRLLGDPARQQVIVLVGPGNNGGDGLVAARHLHDAGAVVELYIWRRSPDTAATDTNWQRCRQRGIREWLAADDPDQAALRSLLGTARLAIDALLGTGASRPVEGSLAAIITVLNDRAGSLRVLAVDLPSGVDADTGAVGSVAVRADLTVATGMIKRGLLCYPGRNYTGRLALVEIGLPAEIEEVPMSELLTRDYARRLLPPRPADAHKGSFGKVLVIAGSLNYPGAAALACGGAARVGAGLVTLGAGRTVLAAAANRQPEITLLPLPEGDWGAIGPAAIDELGKHLEGYAAVLIGPGLGQAESTVAFVQRLFGLDKAKARARVGFLATQPGAEAPVDPVLTELPPLVLDADALNILAGIADWHERLPRGRLVLTPHPGEMRRLLRAEELPGDAPAAAAAAAANWGQVVVLKGATTVIAAPDRRTLIHDGGNPALATAGTGDVLAGAIVGLLAQGLAPFDAAALGVYLHGAAGARVRDDLGDAGALASDVLPELPRAIKALRG